MAALMCDLCGGKLVMGTGGTAVCDSCGMEHSPDRMKEKVQEIKGVVRVDNTHMVDNYLSMATNAYNAKNYAESEGYCNRIIEIDPSNYKAWLFKGMAAGWQSKLQSIRFSECASALAKAIQNAPEEDSEKVIEISKECLRDLALALISLRSDRFTKWPDAEETAGFSNDITSILDAVLLFVTQASAVLKLSAITAPIAEKINIAVVAAWNNKIKPEFNKEEFPNKYDWEEYIQRIGFCTKLLEQAINLCDEDDEEDIQCYKNLIVFHKAAIESRSWKSEFFNFTSYDQWIRENTATKMRNQGMVPDIYHNRVWVVDYVLTDEAKEYRRNKIAEYTQKIREIEASVTKRKNEERAEKERKEREAAEKRRNEYWKAHAEEKLQLERERDTLDGQIQNLRNEIAAIPGNAEIQSLLNKRSRIESEKKGLGLFKGKLKKELQVQIDHANQEIQAIQSRMNEEKSGIEKRISPLEARKREIDHELNKNR